MNPAAERVHGITAQRLKGAPALQEAMQRWVDWVVRMQGGGGGALLLVAHNASFDVRFLRAALAQPQCPAAVRAVFATAMFADSLACARALGAGVLLTQKKPSHKLEDLHTKWCGASFAGAHDAQSDAEALQRVVAAIPGALPWLRLHATGPVIAAPFPALTAPIAAPIAPIAPIAPAAPAPVLFSFPSYRALYCKMCKTWFSPHFTPHQCHHTNPE